MQVGCLFFVLFVPLSVALPGSESAFLWLTIGELSTVLGPPVSVSATSLTVSRMHNSRSHPVSPFSRPLLLNLIFYRK